MLAAPSAERSLKDPRFFPDQRASSAVAVQQQQRALAAGSRQKPQQRAGETGGVSLRSAGRAQVSHALPWSPSDHPLKPDPREGFGPRPSVRRPLRLHPPPGEGAFPKAQAAWLHFLATNHGLWPLRRQREGVLEEEPCW